MANKKSTADKTTKKSPAKRTTKRKPRAKKVAAAEETVVKEVAQVSTDEDIARSHLFGEIFWEYRAKMAEYEKVLLEFKVAEAELIKEKQDPKYSELLKMISSQAQLSEDLKRYASLLRGVQVKVANSLNLDIETFLKECTIDHETGVVTIFD